MKRTIQQFNLSEVKRALGGFCDTGSLANGLVAGLWGINARLVMAKVAKHDESSSEQIRRRLTISLPFDVFSMLAAEEYQRKLEGKDASASTIVSEAVRAFVSKTRRFRG